jgi:hypothetical protein
MKTALESSMLWAVWIFFFVAPTAQNSPELKTDIRKLAQDTSVYCSVLTPTTQRDELSGKECDMSYCTYLIWVSVPNLL